LKGRTKPFPTAQDDARAAELCIKAPQTESPSYRLAYMDPDFIMRDEARPVRLQLELLKPELIQEAHKIESTIVVFGGTRIPERPEAERRLAEAEAAHSMDPENPDLARGVRIARSILDKCHFYDEARKLGTMVSGYCEDTLPCTFVVITGGGPGIMEAANRGAHDIGAKTIGLNIVLPFEQQPNAYVTPELSFQFHYFAIRKMHFLMRARALVAFPGGYGTLDELFETLTLIQTRKVAPVPVILFGRDFWKRIINFEALVEEGTISPQDIDIFQYADTAEEAFALIRQFYAV